MKQPNKRFMAEIQQARRASGQSGHESAPAEDSAAAGATNNQEVLLAIADLSSKIDRYFVGRAELDTIQVELSDISGRIKATKIEMAQLRHPLAEEDKFLAASEELSAVVSATEVATNTIMSCAEMLEEIGRDLGRQLPESAAGRIAEMQDIVVRIFEACNFQDLTGQRIGKVVRALSFIEERVDAMMSLWNRREFETMPLPPTLIKTDGGLLLHGPAEVHATTGSSGAISQAEIDALFD